MSPLPAAIAATPPTGVPEWIPGALMALGVAVITTWSLMRLRARYKRRQNTSRGPNAFALAKASRQTVLRPGTPAEGELSCAETKALRSDLQSLMVDVQEVTRQCAAQIENRAAMLDRLIADADAKINRLEHLLSRAHAIESSAPQSSTQARPESKADPTDPLTRRVLEMALNGHSPVHIASVLNEQVGKVNLILALHAPAPRAQTASG